MLLRLSLHGSSSVKQEKPTAGQASTPKVPWSLLSVRVRNTVFIPLQFQRQQRFSSNRNRVPAGHRKGFASTRCRLPPPRSFQSQAVFSALPPKPSCTFSPVRQRPPQTPPCL